MVSPCNALQKLLLISLDRDKHHHGDHGKIAKDLDPCHVSLCQNVNQLRLLSSHENTLSSPTGANRTVTDTPMATATEATE